MNTKPLETHPPVELVAEFEKAFHDRPDFFVRAPGRVDLIGTHTDYNEGWVLPAAVDRYVWLAVKELPTTMVSLRVMASPDGEIPQSEAVAFRLTELDEKTSITGQPLPHWALYSAGVAWSLQESGLATPGTQIVLNSNVPIGAGLSSSAAIEVAFATAWAHITGWEVEKMELAQICQRAENDYVGVNCGLMDQFSSMFGRKGKALLFDCRTREWQAVPFPDDVTLVLADTTSRRKLAGSAYNERRAECDEATAVFQQYIPNIHALRDVSISDFEGYGDLIPEPARQRAQHVIEENARVQAAARALRAGEPELLGQYLDESYISSRDLFDASGPELEVMWQASQGHPARLGGRFAGAGWAGCMVFVVKTDGVNGFIDYLETRYQEATGLEPLIYALKPATGAQIFPGQGI